MKKRASDLIAIPGHRNYYRSPVSGIIYYKDSTTPKFSTGETMIGRARRVVELKKLELAGKSAAEAKNKVHGVTNPLLKFYWDELMDLKRKESSRSTMIKFDVSWRHGLEGFWGNKTVAELTDKNIESYRDWYLQNHGNRGAEKTVIHFGMLCRYMLKRKVIAFLPDLDFIKGLDQIVAKNTQRKKLGRVYDEKMEIQPLLAAAKSVARLPYLNHRTYLGILLGARCGLRKMEILKLKKEDLDFQNGIIRVWSQKNFEWREVPMITEVKMALATQLEFSGNSIWLFPMASDSSRHITSQVFDRNWVRTKKNAGIRNWNVKGAARFHDLRHTCATRTAEPDSSGRVWPPVAACKFLDMSLKIYQQVYAKPSTAVIAHLMRGTFEATNEVA